MIDMIGQYSNEDFLQMYRDCKNFKGCDIGLGTAWMQYGRQTYNYYRQESDRSWTNCDCKTKLIFL